MESHLKPHRFESNPDTSTAQAEWLHWSQTFQNFIESMDKAPSEENKLCLLVNYISPTIYTYISGSKTYEEAIKLLNEIFIKPKNVIYARHKLSTRSQGIEETLDQFMQALKIASQDCNFRSVTAEENKNEYIRDAFISGLKSNYIRQRLLENTNLTLEQAFNQSRSLEMAETQAQSYSQISLNSVSKIQSNTNSFLETNSMSIENDASASQVSAIKSKCYFCGGVRHKRENCPAKDVMCHNCKKIGHFKKVCNSGKTSKSQGVAAVNLCAASPQVLSKATLPALVNNYKFHALVDTGSSESFINKQVVRAHRFKCYSGKLFVSMASTSMNSEINEYCLVKLEFLGHTYHNVKLFVMENLCSDLIMGHDILKQHSSLEISFGGQNGPLKICSLAQATIPPVKIFSNLSSNHKPIAIKSRNYSQEDSKFIKEEVKRLLHEGIIEESHSPWRAQVLIVKGDSRKKRMVVDYSQTVNRFTELDAYPLPKIEDIVNEVSKYKMYSTIDLRSAYHQIPIAEEDKPFTGFEADGRLFQFRRIPFGVTQGVPAFQRVMDEIIIRENLQKTKAYLDDITIAGDDKSDHEQNLIAFLNAARKYNLTINTEKSKFRQTEIKLLGYAITYRSIKPDPDRFKPLLDLTLPKDIASLRRTMGMFAHYANLIPQFSEKIQVFSNNHILPLPAKSISAFNQLKSDISNAVKSPIEENIPFTVETDASDYAISAILSQSGRPVAFFSKSLNKSEKGHSVIEKEAQAIVEALKHWRHYLVGRPFSLITDQKSVAFMFNNKSYGKIKNEKIQRWRLELSCFKYDIIYRPGRENTIADTLSRACSITGLSLKDIHDSLCHPGVTRLYHWVRSKNLPFSIEEVRKTTASCQICAELKPRFCKYQGHLIKATSPFERLNIDFKGPMPFQGKNKYILTIVDEFSRFPFAFPCVDMTSSTVINCLQKLFYTFGMPNYIHSDRGTSFLSQEIKNFLSRNGIASSYSTPYNPKGNGQVERYNGVIWKTVSLALKSHGLDSRYWEQVLDEALHSIRSLLCTSTNETPHERMFRHSRKSFYGHSLPIWLTNPGPVLLRKFDRHSKYDPPVQVVDLLEANPEYARIRFQDGRESNISLRHLAPVGDEIPEENDANNYKRAIEDRNPMVEEGSTQPLQNTTQSLEVSAENTLQSQETSSTQESLQREDTKEEPTHQELPRRSNRPRYPPRRFQDYLSK